MLARPDYVVVGSGVTGATIARAIKDAGCSVLVLERRGHVGGNVFDTVHWSGIPYHVHGPHYFWTGSARLWEYVNRFSVFDRFVAEVQCVVNGKMELWPVRTSVIDRINNEGWTPTSRVGTEEPENFEAAALRLMPRSVYDLFVAGYTSKQWGADPKALSSELASRLSVRDDDAPCLRHHAYQGLPRNGFTSWVEAMLRGIDVQLEVDYLPNRTRYQPNRGLVFTGAIDEFFGYDLGRLRYRAQRRDHIFLPLVAGTAFPCVQVNYPGAEVGYVRSVEWKHLLPAGKRPALGTLITLETPYSPVASGEYEYPYPSTEDQMLYRRYRERANAIPELLICGRLGEYRYFDMDQAIARAQMWASRLLHRVAAELS